MYNGQERATLLAELKPRRSVEHGVQTGRAWWGKGGETSPPLPWSVQREPTSQHTECNSSGPRTTHREPGLALQAHFFVGWAFVRAVVTQANRHLRTAARWYSGQDGLASLHRRA